MANRSDELNKLFERFVSGKDKKLHQVEELKKKITAKLDEEIAALYKRKDFVAEIFARRIELKKYRRSVLKKFFFSPFILNLRYIASMPFIYMMWIPLWILHVFLEVYHQVCFRFYGIPRVNPREYFVIDRAMLPYLNWLEKFNCFYCSYANCLIAYAREIAARTEQFWCPIKHARRVAGSHERYADFVDYDDAKSLRKRWDDLRKFNEK